jgi:translation initiation factor 2B subunit (eIF-2B alpha/beta/delta family)
MTLKALRSAASDRRSGSAVVAAQAASALAHIACHLSSEAIVDATRLLVEGQPVMASCLRLADWVLRELDESGPPGACSAANAFEALLRSERETLAERVRARLPKEGTIVTVSASSTVLEALRTARGVRVLCAVSDPGGEGRQAVETLRDAGVEADLIPDGAVAQQSARADLVLFGGDAIGSTGVINKVGTLAAALGARSAGRPCVCAVGTTKLVDDVAWPHLARAVEERKVEGIPLFEEIPLPLFRTIVMDEGPRTTRTVRRVARAAALHPSVLEWLGARGATPDPSATTLRRRG